LAPGFGEGTDVDVSFPASSNASTNSDLPFLDSRGRYCRLSTAVSRHSLKTIRQELIPADMYDFTAISKGEAGT
jgi:hypothetical protein